MNPSTLMLSPDTERVLGEMEARTNARQGNDWRDVLDVYRLLAPLPRRSPHRKALIGRLTEVLRRKERTVQRMVQIVTACTDPETGEITLPFRLDWTTALALVQADQGFKTLMMANDAAWTREQALEWLRGERRADGDDAALPTLKEQVGELLVSDEWKLTVEDAAFRATVAKLAMRVAELGE